jgi:hypothetical protein
MPPAGFDWPRVDMPIAMIPVHGSGESGEGVSKLNRAEAEVVTQVVVGLLRAGVAAADIGVISPYAAQVHTLRSLLRSSGARTGGGDGQLEVSSVDGFQGREKEVIIFSCVRSNAGGRLGFLADARRLNVAFTRAKRGLIVLGHPPTLAKDPNGPWAHWLRWARYYGLVLGEPPSGEYDATATRAASVPLMASYEPPSEAEAEAQRAAARDGEKATWLQLAMAFKHQPTQRVGDREGRQACAGAEEPERGRSRSRRSRSRRSYSRSSSRSRSRSSSYSRSSYSRSSYSRSSDRSRHRRRSRSPSDGPPVPASLQPASLPAPWTAVQMPNGNVYYWNQATNQTTFTRPGAPSPTSSLLPAPWTAVQMPDGNVYYWNQATNQTTFTRPV